MQNQGMGIKTAKLRKREAEMPKDASEKEIEEIRKLFKKQGIDFDKYVEEKKRSAEIIKAAKRRRKLMRS